MSPALRENGPLQPDFSAGIFRDVAPELIPPNGAYDIVNGLLDEDGHPYRRGGTAYHAKLLPSAAGILDNFNRANETPVSQAGKWVGTFQEYEPFKVSGNKLVPAVPGATLTSGIYDVTAANEVVYATILKVGTSNLLYVRTAGEEAFATSRGYELELVGNQWTLYRIDPEGGVRILAQREKIAAAGGAFALMAVGEEISAWQKREGGSWTRVLTASDSTYESGRIGIGTIEGEYDDFGGGSLTPFSSSGLTWIWDGYLAPGQRTLFADSSNFGTLASDDSPVNLGGAGLSVPKQSAAIEDLLFIGGGAIYGGSRKTANYTTGTISVEKGSKVVKGAGGTAWKANVDAGMLLQIGTARVYLVASVQSDTELTLRDAYEGTTEEGKTYTAFPLYTVGSDPYETWDFLCVCANRLVLLNGRTVKYTEVDDPHTFTNSLGTTNEHTLPEGVEGLGLATVGQTVLIFTTAGIWVLDGLALDIVDQNGNPQHRIQQLSSEIILAGAPGIAGAGQRLVIPAIDGVYLMDGISQPVRISHPIDRFYREQIEGGYKVGKAEVFRGHYLLPIITGSGAVRKLLVCYLDRPTRSSQGTIFPWTRFNGDGGEITAFAIHVPTSGEPLLLGAQARTPSQVVDCSHYFAPDDEHETDADGSVHNFDSIQRDYETGGRTINRVRAMKPRYELRGAHSPKLLASYSLGGNKATGPKFGSAIFGEAVFASSGGVTFTPVGEAGESDAHNPARFRVNKAARFLRTRLKTSGQASVFSLRSLELTVRPSGATRR